MRSWSRCTSNNDFCRITPEVIPYLSNGAVKVEVGIVYLAGYYYMTRSSVHIDAIRGKLVQFWKFVTTKVSSIMIVVVLIAGFCYPSHRIQRAFSSLVVVKWPFMRMWAFHWIISSSGVSWGEGLSPLSTNASISATCWPCKLPK